MSTLTSGLLLTALYYYHIITEKNSAAEISILQRYKNANNPFFRSLVLCTREAFGFLFYLSLEREIVFGDISRLL